MKADSKEKIVQDKLIDNYIKYYRIAYSYVSNEHDAYDVVQEASYKAILKCNSLRKIEYVDTWICRIVINESNSLLRKKYKKELSLGDIEQEGTIGEVSNIENIDLMKALEKLNSQERTLIILRFFEDYKIEDIAFIMKLNVNTVKTKLYRTISKMEKILGKEA